MFVVNDRSGSRYTVGEKVAETERYRLYLCRPDGKTEDHLLQVASTVEHNGALDRNAYILEKLLYEAEQLEEEYTRVKSNPKHLLNYQLGFPEVVDTFVSADQGNRRVNVLRFREVDDVRNMVPLYNLVHRDKLRVDLKTSVWILGRLLKTLTFVHSIGIAPRDLMLGNVLIEPNKHYVVIFNWANALVSDGRVERAVVREEIKAAARMVIEVLGGPAIASHASGEEALTALFEQGGVPSDGSEQHVPYENHLLPLAVEGNGDAQEAHREFYQLVDGLWPRGFHKFQALPRG